jgi:serine protease
MPADFNLGFPHHVRGLTCTAQTDVHPPTGSQTLFSRGQTPLLDTSLNRLSGWARASEGIGNLEQSPMHLGQTEVLSPLLAQGQETPMLNYTADVFSPSDALTPNLSAFTWDDLTTGMSTPWSNLQPTQALSTFQADVTALDANAATSVKIVNGSLWADTFTYTNDRRTVFSGNGNINFGEGWRDLLNLSSISSRTVSFNLATAQGGGVIYNPGSGSRVFDSLTLSNGNQILFEGIDRIQFADGALNLAVVPNDPGFNYQWNLPMMGVQGAWRFTTGSQQVAIGIEDTGLGVNGSIHPDLRASNTYIYGRNYYDDFERDYTSHGTDVQGIIVAASNNGFGMTGINWQSRVFQTDVLGGDAADLSLGAATQLMANSARLGGERLVINMSLGYSESQGRTGLDPEFEQAVANNPNVLFVIASGNDDLNGLSYPGSLANKYANVMAIGAVWGSEDYYGNYTTPGTRISYPGWWGSNYGEGLTLMGPSEVISTSATNWSDGVRFDYDLQFNGTSAATPNVTGVASLVWSANANLTAAQVRQVLAETAYDRGAPGYDRVYGSGVVNADKAVRRAMAIAAGAA